MQQGLEKPRQRRLDSRTIACSYVHALAKVAKDRARQIGISFATGDTREHLRAEGREPAEGGTQRERASFGLVLSNSLLSLERVAAWHGNMLETH